MSPFCEWYLQRNRTKIGEATRNPSEIRAGKTRIYNYVHMEGRRVECRRRKAQGNLTTNAGNMDITQVVGSLKLCPLIRDRYLRRSQMPQEESAR